MSALLSDFTPDSHDRDLLLTATRYWDDVLALAVLTPVFWSLCSYFLLPKKHEPGYDLLFASPQRQDGLLSEKEKTSEDARDINRKLNDAATDVVVFWGSQSGRAAQFARQLARELHSNGIAATAEDLDLYDHEHLAQVSRDKVLGFVVSTFGEGDPPDNAAGLWDALREFNKSKTDALSGLRYFVFGLGDSKYEQYNQFALNIDQQLQEAGAQRVGDLGKCDVSKAADDGWMDWKETIMQQVSDLVPARLPKTVASLYEADIDITDLPQDDPALPPALLAAELGRTKVHTAPVSSSRLLSAPGSRAYIHLEFDISAFGPDFTYSTGDHLAVWPMNSDQEISRLAALFGWSPTVLAAPINITARSSTDTTTLALGQTTRLSLLRHHLDIAGPLTVQTVRLLAHFAPTPESKTYLNTLLASSTQVADLTSSHTTLAGVMALSLSSSSDPTPGTSTPITWSNALFPLLLQTLQRIQPRYFSISSSPLCSPDKVSITVGVLTVPVSNTDSTQPTTFFGLASGYLLSLHQTFQTQVQGHGHGHPSPGTTSRSPVSPPTAPTYTLSPPRTPTPTLGSPNAASHGEGSCTAQISLRPSSFRPPTDPTVPVVLVAAGSGVAPFLGFITERAELRRRGGKVGRCLLFFGCRNPTEDFLYGETWEQIRSEHDFLEVETAFSRPGEQGGEEEGKKEKMYVQDKLEERKGEVARLVKEEGGRVYICGGVAMARAVKEGVVGGVEGGGEGFGGCLVNGDGGLVLGGFDGFDDD
ncbi:riboflavin synthase domain-like protein [Coniochaeta ligniaria NRRL 30616]|uniref:Cellulase n=1 Tax=Coniochaeta ligniaria NRRL 30616 TaxID=1408157 RepID=A0A1J7IQ60_9PEZI|nr:riboflavin synthase domain-like protein [Coniochaeta ligniaria NRRL 30616]